MAKMTCVNCGKRGSFEEMEARGGVGQCVHCNENLYIEKGWTDDWPEWAVPLLAVFIVLGFLILMAVLE